MDDVEEKILSYPHLPVKEQREIETYVESNPEWAPLLEDVRSLEVLARDAQGGRVSNALLATYVTVQELHPGEIPSTLRTAFSRLEAQFEEDDALRRKADEMRRRVRETEAALDPVSHFEELAGRSLEEEAAPGRVEATEPGPVEGQETAPSVLNVFLSLPVLVRRAAVGAVFLFGLYGALYATSVATQSTRERLAAVDVSDQVIENYATTEMRSAGPEPDTLSIDERYLEAISVLRAARTSTLGLFPRYHAEKLERAERLLKQVLDRVEPGSFLALEVHFYLGKVSLAQGDVDVARNHFKTVVKQEGRKVEEAHEILNTLHQESVGRSR